MRGIGGRTRTGGIGVSGLAKQALRRLVSYANFTLIKNKAIRPKHSIVRGISGRLEVSARKRTVFPSQFVGHGGFSKYSVRDPSGFTSSYPFAYRFGVNYRPQRAPTVAPDIRPGQ
jgi:hypothetical protein